jgi:TIR domain
MDRGERISLIMKLASRLDGMSPPDRDLTLRQFGYPTEYQPEEQTDYEFAIQELEREDDGTLLELHSHLYPDDTLAETTSDEGQRGPWEAGAFRLFLSHTSGNRKRAGLLRKALTPWGVDTFVAHDAIEPTREWQDEIERALRTCDALCALLTSDFAESRWCDQEVGFAFARSILIVPLKIDADPHGFIGKYQALSVPVGATGSGVADLLYVSLSKNQLTADAMAPVIVRRFEGSDSFDEARAAFALLREIPGPAWSATMIERVERAIKENDQIFNGNLPGGRSISEAAAELIREIKGPEPPPPNDDIPF